MQKHCRLVIIIFFPNYFIFILYIVCCCRVMLTVLLLCYVEECMCAYSNVFSTTALLSFSFPFPHLILLFFFCSSLFLPGPCHCHCQLYQSVSSQPCRPSSLHPFISTPHPQNTLRTNVSCLCLWQADRPIGLSSSSIPTIKFTH